LAASKSLWHGTAASCVFSSLALSAALTRECQILPLRDLNSKATWLGFNKIDQQLLLSILAKPL
jgi:hypothetical protein